jgi:anthranilate phosphoribosyltransferase
VGIKKATAEALRGGDAETNATALMAVLQGTKGPFRDVALLNAAAALVVAGRAQDLKEGLSLAAQAVDSGAAKDRLDRLVAVSNATTA